LLHYSRLESRAKYKHSSLFGSFVSYKNVVNAIPDSFFLGRKFLPPLISAFFGPLAAAAAAAGWLEPLVDP
jgi:hypothetical protein